MILNFSKYQGAGNDFIIIDNRTGFFNNEDQDLISRLCDRRFGIGADGLMLVQDKEKFDFEMVYFNSDGFEGTMCGNGGRCIVAFAYNRKIIGDSAKFMAIDGEHDAVVLSPNYVKLKMGDVHQVETGEDYYFLNTGSPHYVTFRDSLEKFDVYQEGRKIRYNDRFKLEGTNVNFVELRKNALFVRTYERGVEDETYACGTGITASAIAAALKLDVAQSEFNVKALGGDLKVSFSKKSNAFENIWLEGPATPVFDGTIKV